MVDSINELSVKTIFAKYEVSKSLGTIKNEITEYVHKTHCMNGAGNLQMV